MFNSLNDLPSHDCTVTFNPSGAVSTDFKSEDELNSYIEDNIGLFCKDVLSDNYLSHKREYEGKIFLKRGVRTKEEKNRFFY